MASLSFQDSQGRKGWRIRFRNHHQRQKSIWLGSFPEHSARETLVHVEHLADCLRDGLPPASVTSRWLATINDKLRNKLATAGLCESVAEKKAVEITVALWIDEYIEENDFKHCTYHQTRDNLVDYFGKRKKLRAVSVEDAKKFRIWLSTSGKRRTKGKDKSLAEATVRKRTQICKQYFGEALERGYIDANPFAKLKSGSVGNSERQFFVSQQVAEACIERAPCTDWRTIIALCRFGGLRCPSEVLGLKWADVDLPKGVMMIDSPKTGLRACPIFKELRPYLEAAWNEAKEGSTHVINRYRSVDQNLRTTFTKIIKAAGHKPWPRLFQNLRASCETELLGKYPAPDVVSWIGNSVAVAMQHYAMTREESFREAAGLDGGHNGGHISGHSGIGSNNQSESENPINAKKSGLVLVGDGSPESSQYAKEDSNLRPTD